MLLADRNFPGYELWGLAAATPPTAPPEPFRLVTSLLDHRLAPAAKLAALYHERWESENGYGELKTRLRGAEFILRSKSPNSSIRNCSRSSPSTRRCVPWRPRPHRPPASIPTGSPSP
jgi:hypothetical protein